MNRWIQRNWLDPFHLVFDQKIIGFLNCSNPFFRFAQYQAFPYPSNQNQFEHDFLYFWFVVCFFVINGGNRSAVFLLFRIDSKQIFFNVLDEWLFWLDFWRYQKHDFVHLIRLQQIIEKFPWRRWIFISIFKPMFPDRQIWNFNGSQTFLSFVPSTHREPGLRHTFRPPPHWNFYWNTQCIAEFRWSQSRFWTTTTILFLSLEFKIDRFCRPMKGLIIFFSIRKHLGHNAHNYNEEFNEKCLLFECFIHSLLVLLVL